jgi:hypothetical protein
LFSPKSDTREESCAKLSWCKMPVREWPGVVVFMKMFCAIMMDKFQGDQFSNQGLLQIGAGPMWKIVSIGKLQQRM